MLLLLLLLMMPLLLFKVFNTFHTPGDVVAVVIIAVVVQGFEYILHTGDVVATVVVVVEGFKTLFTNTFPTTGDVHQLRQVLHDVQRLRLPSHHLRPGDASHQSHQGMHWVHPLCVCLPHCGLHQVSRRTVFK